MKFAAILLVTLAIGATCQAQEASGTGTVRQLTVEVKSLKLDLVRFQLEHISRLIPPIERELAWIDARRTRLTRTEKALRDGAAAAAAQQIPASTLTPIEQRELDEISSAGKPRNDLSAARAEIEDLTRREAELGQQLHFERQRWQQAQATAAALEAELNRLR